MRLWVAPALSPVRTPSGGTLQDKVGSKIETYSCPFASRRTGVEAPPQRAGLTFRATGESWLKRVGQPPLPSAQVEDRTSSADPLQVLR